MQESTLTKVALISTLLGLCTLYLMANQPLPPSSLAEVEARDTGKTLKVKGVVQQATELDTIAFLTIAEERLDTAEVVLFKNHAVEIKPGSYVEVEGVIDEYEGKPQLLANKIQIR